jgi:hypothetical protein
MTGQIRVNDLAGKCLFLMALAAAAHGINLYDIRTIEAEIDLVDRLALSRLDDRSAIGRDKPSRFRRIHHPLADAVRAAKTVRMIIIENVPAADINRREREVIGD